VAGSTRAESQPQKMARLLMERGPMTATELCAVSGFDARQLRHIAQKARTAGLHVYSREDLWRIDMPGMDGMTL
jgi:hypothetical protein